MIYDFDDCELDISAFELRRGGVAAPVEPQVFALLALLVENRARMVSRDEIIEKIWGGRIVSEAALASRVKSARQAIGDDGKAQKCIKTIHGKGFRFVGDASVRQKATIETPITDELNDFVDSVAGDGLSAKPSIAVLPFRLVGVAGPYAGMAEALPHELISVMSKLRWLFVIARGSSFRFSSSDPDLKQIGRVLGVRYCLSGVVEIVGERIGVSVELAETANGAVLWGERYAAKADDVHEIREQIVASVVSALELQIPVNEAIAARLKQPEKLDAWSAYHLGVHHLYRFNQKDNDAAAAMFQRAVALEPGFARAHAGLSSIHFQNAFMGYVRDLDEGRRLAKLHADRAVELDPLDPFSNFAMGRTHWIDNDVAGGAEWFDRAVSLSPNYAQGLYARGWANAVSGSSAQSVENIDLALSLSPLDPFRYAMLGVRSFNCIMEGDFTAGAYWADKAARSPGAHVLIAAIAAGASQMNGDDVSAKQWAENVRARRPDLTQADFFRSFPFEHRQTRERFSSALAKCGFK